MFKKLFNKSAKSFDDVKIMTTRNLPIPHVPDMESFATITAKRNKDGYWTLSLKHNLKTVTTGIEKVNQAYREAFNRHIYKTGMRDVSLDSKMTFDTAFIILRDMEESLLNYSRQKPDTEPKTHFMAAYRFAPDSLKNELDNRFFKKRSEKGFLLTPPDDGRNNHFRMGRVG